MSHPYEIRYLKTAEGDLNNIFDYIRKDNQNAALSLIEKFDNSVSNLALNPKLGKVPKDDRLMKLGYRVLIIDKYLVFYVVKKNIVQIRSVIHGARQYSFIL